MIKKKLIIFLITIFLISAFAESYDVKGIEEMDYVIAIGIDKSSSDPEEYSITFQIAKPNDKESGKTTSETVTINCPAFDIGLSAINSSNDKLLNLTHCSAIIISEELAKDGLEPIIFNMENNVELRPTCHLLISKEKSESFIKAIGNSPSFSSDIYNDIIKSSLTTGYETQTLLYNFYSDRRYNIKEPIAIYVGNTETKAEPIGIAVFKKDKLVGFIAGTEVICHNILSNNLQNASLLIPNPYDQTKFFTADISLSHKTKISSEIKNDIPQITCDFYIKARISSSQTTNDDYTSKTENEKISNSIEKYLTTSIYSYLLKTSKDFNSDIIGFEGTVRKKFLTMDEYKEKVDWNKQYNNAEFKVIPHIDIDSSYLFQRH